MRYHSCYVLSNRSTNGDGYMCLRYVLGVLLTIVCIWSYGVVSQLPIYFHLYSLDVSYNLESIIDLRNTVLKTCTNVETHDVDLHDLLPSLKYNVNICKQSVSISLLVQKTTVRQKFVVLLSYILAIFNLLSWHTTLIIRHKSRIINSDL